MENLNSILEPLVIDKTRLRLLASAFSENYRDLALNSLEQFLPTPVTALPLGTETGTFLAIDVGGTNLRVGFIELLGDGVKTQKQRIRRLHEKVWPISQHLKMDKEDLFAFIGDCIAEVVANAIADPAPSGLGFISESGEIPLGTTFSFPMMQPSIEEAKLMPVGKGFDFPPDLDLAKLLIDGYEKHTTEPMPDASPNSHAAKRRKRTKLPRLKIVAITNDTVATLASLAYSIKSLPRSRVAMGLIVGTGTNATIPMKMKDLHPSKRTALSLLTPRDSVTDDTEIVVNTEWSIRGTAKPLHDLNIVTKWDTLLDQQSKVPGFQPFEYMTAGLYLGELVRLILVDVLTRTQNITEDELPAALKERETLTTTFLATVVASEAAPAALIPQLQHRFPPPTNGKFHWNQTTRDIVRRVARLVQIRSASLTAAALVGLLACVGEIELPSPAGMSHDRHAPQPLHLSDDEEELVVAFTGGTILYYPDYLDCCQKCVNDLVTSALPSVHRARKRVVLREAKDGGIIGAGVLAGTVRRAAGA